MQTTVIGSRLLALAASMATGIVLAAAGLGMLMALQVPRPPVIQTFDVALLSASNG